ncbi:uncharacterized protein DS421_15g523630 [Arachis hypogaea]|nr:uncharacterized protein DS421_15g523630 [Arachis hypogaea]
MRYTSKFWQKIEARSRWEEHGTRKNAGRQKNTARGRSVAREERGAGEERRAGRSVATEKECEGCESRFLVEGIFNGMKPVF